MRKLSAFFNHIEKAKILDVGTGNGNFIKMIQSMTDEFEEIIGIDELDIAIETSKKNFDDERIKFIKMDAFDMDFEDGYFDVVCLSNSLHHLSNINGMLKEMARVLKPNGYLLVNEMKSDGLNARQKGHMKIHHFAAEIDREVGATHNDTFTARGMLEILDKESELQIKDVWDLTYDRPEVNSQEEIDWLCSTIDKVQQKITDPSRQDYFKSKGEKIKKYIKRVGFDSQTQVIVILK